MSASRVRSEAALRGRRGGCRVATVGAGVRYSGLHLRRSSVGSVRCSPVAKRSMLAASTSPRQRCSNLSLDGVLAAHLGDRLLARANWPSPAPACAAAKPSGTAPCRRVTDPLPPQEMRVVGPGGRRTASGCCRRQPAATPALLGTRFGAALYGVRKRPCASMRRHGRVAPAPKATRRTKGGDGRRTQLG